MKNILLLIALIAQCLKAQTIKGCFPQAKKTQIMVNSFNGFDEVELSKTLTDSLGNFTLVYPKTYKGAAILQIKNISSVIIMLNLESFEMQWQNIQDFTTLKFINSPENDAFSRGVAIYQETELKLQCLQFLQRQYNDLATQKQWLKAEINNQRQQFTNFLNQLPKESYAKYYLEIRKLITDFPQTSKLYTERILQHEVDFNRLNFNEPSLHTSGLLKELIEGYFMLMESYYEPNEMYQHINASVDALLKSLEQNSSLQQVVAQNLFYYFEKRSLYKSAEYLALAMLKSNCQLSVKSTNLFEQYRKLAIGKIAPNIVFEDKESKGKKQDLRNINNAYKLVVFGASWCPNCQIDLPKIKEKYKTLKETYDVEIVYISIDTNKKLFENYYKDVPFIKYCDTKGWETKAALDYHIIATPTYILLDRDLKIVAKINSTEHLEAWLQANAKKLN